MLFIPKFSSVFFLTQDNNTALKNTIRDVFPHAKWQYCAAHLFRNTLRETSNKYKKSLAVLLSNLKEKKDFESANKYALVISGFLEEKKQFTALKSFDDNYQSSLKYLDFNEEIHRFIFTNNALERVNGSIRQREKIIKIFPNVDSANRLAGSILIDIDETYQTGNCNYAMIADYRQP